MSVPTSHFDALYEAAADPWGFTQRWYEQRKYAVTLASLPDARYASAYEPGCSIGVLTAALAERCDHVLASDASAAAVGRTRERVAALPQVTVEQRRLPQEWPSGSFDLVLLSELLYFLDLADLSAVVQSALDCLSPGGVLMAVHWRHFSDDHPLSTAQIHEQLAHACADAGLAHVVAHAEPDFVLDVHVRPRPGETSVSVAARDGLV